MDGSSNSSVVQASAPDPKRPKVPRDGTAARLDAIEAKLDLLLAFHQQRPGVGVELIAAAIAPLCGAETFTAARIVSLANSDLSTRAGLRAALAGRSAKALGKLLVQYAGQTLRGYRLERIGCKRPAVYRLSAFERHERHDGFNWPR